MVTKLFNKGLILLIVLLIYISGNIGCAFQKLALNKVDYNGSNIRIDGYYYTQYNNIYRIIFLYRNGVIFSGGDVYMMDILDYENKYIDGSFWTTKCKNKLYWGVYNITDEKIEYEKWYPASGGPLPSYINSGKIINDTTFVITKSMRSNGSNVQDEYDVYHFKKLSPKPDSTNKFIK